MTIDVATKQFNSAIVTGEFRGIVDCYETSGAEFDDLACAGDKTINHWSDIAARYLEAAKLTFLSWF